MSGFPRQMISLGTRPAGADHRAAARRRNVRGLSTAQTRRALSDGRKRACGMARRDVAAASRFPRTARNLTCSSRFCRSRNQRRLAIRAPTQKQIRAANDARTANQSGHERFFTGEHGTGFRGRFAMRNDFTNAVLNPLLDKNLFEWQPPDDFKVTSPFSQ
jgi:hypothetical protein